MVLHESSSVFLLLIPIAHWALLRLNQIFDQDPLVHLRQGLRTSKLADRPEQH